MPTKSTLISSLYRQTQHKKGKAEPRKAIICIPMVALNRMLHHVPRTHQVVSIGRMWYLEKIQLIHKYGTLNINHKNSYFRTQREHSKIS